MVIFALLTVPFVFTLGGFVFAGLLEPMADDLGVSVAAVATLQAGFALACALSGPVLAKLTGQMRRKPLLLATLAVLLVLNALSALVPDFATLMAARIAVGALGALALPLAIAIGAGHALPERRAGTIAAIYAGVALALMLGIPAGSVIGGALGWRACFWLTAGLCLVSLALVASRVPDLPAQPMPAGRSPLPAASLGLLAVTLLAFTAMFALVGFIGPVITALTGFGPNGIALFQLLIGFSCFAGLRLGAWLAARPAVPGLALLFIGIILALGMLVHPLSLGAATGYGLAAMALSTLIAPASQFGTAPIVQTRLTETAGPATTFALALNGSMVYLGQGLGVAIGALAISQWGLIAAPVAGAAIAGVGLLVVLYLRPGVTGAVAAPTGPAQ